MRRFLRRWPFLVAGLLCLASAVGLAELNAQPDDQRAVIVFVAAIGAILVGYGIGAGPSDDG